MEESFTRDRILKVLCANRKPPLLLWDTLPISSGLRGRVASMSIVSIEKTRALDYRAKHGRLWELAGNCEWDYTPSSTEVDCVVWYKPSSSLHLFVGLLQLQHFLVTLCKCAHVWTFVEVRGILALVLHLMLYIQVSSALVLHLIFLELMDWLASEFLGCACLFPVPSLQMLTSGFWCEC